MVTDESASPCRTRRTPVLNATIQMRFSRSQNMGCPPGVKYAGAGTLEFIVDDNPLKIGKFAPGGNVPILSVDALRDTNAPVCVVVLAWNFFDEIVARIKVLGRQQPDVFVRYFPERDVCDG